MQGNNKHLKFIEVVTNGRTEVASTILVSVYFLRWVEDMWVSIMYFTNFMYYITHKPKMPSSFYYNTAVWIVY